MARTPTNHIIFWKSEMKTFRCIYVTCLNRLSCCVQNNIEKKCIFLDNLRTITQEGNMDTRQMTPLWILNINFHVIPPLVNPGLLNANWSFLAKNHWLGELLTFSKKVDALRLLKIYIMLFVPIRWSQITIFLSSSSWTIYTISGNGNKTENKNKITKIRDK